MTSSKRVQGERRIWDAGQQAFVSTGEIVQDDAAMLETGAKDLSRSASRFLKGPVPWLWIVLAERLPGKALIVGLCLWRLTGATKCQTVTLGNADLGLFGI